MNKAILSLVLGTLLTSLIAQDEIEMSVRYSSDNPDLTDILYFEKIDYFKVKMTGSLKGSNYRLISKEIWDGEITRIDTLVDTFKNSNLGTIKSDEFQFRIIGKKDANDKLKVNFIFDRFRFSRMYNATISDEYSLRALGPKFQLEKAKQFFAFAYIMPYEKDGWKYFCAVDSSGDDVLSWGEEFNLKHYLVFEMLFDD